MTEDHIQQISERITAPRELRRLGRKLGLPDHTINAIFTNYRDDITQQAYWVLRAWKDNKTSAEEAFEDLWKALCESDLINVAHDILKCGASLVKTATEVSKYYG